MATVTYEEFAFNENDSQPEQNGKKDYHPRLTEALADAAREWPVFPCYSAKPGCCTCREWKTCTDPGKHPRTENGFLDATLDEQQIKKWWLEHPTSNIGIATGKVSNTVVIDVDPRNSGDESLARLEQQYGRLPETVESKTGSDGAHRIFAYPDGIEWLKSSKGEIAPGIDIKADGGYIIAPGSSHVSGNTYEWELSHHPDEVPLAPLPDWLLKLILATHTTGKKNQTTADTEIPEGQRNDTLFRLACSMRAKGWSQEAILAALLVQNDQLCKPPLERREVEKIAGSAGKYEPGTSGQGNGEEKAGEKELPKIQVTTDIAGMVDAAEAALLTLPGPVLYQRARMICRIAPAGKSPRWIQRPPDAPIITLADSVSLRELSAQSAQWVKYDKRAGEWNPALPPEFVFKTLVKRVTLRFPYLEGVVCTPTLRPDGVLISNPGYDEETGLYLDFNGTTFPSIPEAPSREEAKAALGALYTPFADFLFKDDCHRSATMAAVLTLIARFAIAGCVPAFPLRSHTKGSGKGLLVNTIATIGTGRTAPTWTQTLDEGEEAKRLLSIALAGDACMHIDNVTYPFGSAKLDSAVTTLTVKDRLLGVNDNKEAPWLTVIFASGNNMTFRGDMVRRVVPIDLDPKMEHPEERSDFQIKKLLDWVRTERPRLVVAALTALKAYFHAGCPKQNLTEFGSFEAWSDLIRHSLVWAGWPDPCEGRKNLDEQSDTSYEALAALLHFWGECYPDGKARTLKTIIQDIECRKVQTPDAVTQSNKWNALHDALSSYDNKHDGKTLNIKRIGNAIRTIEGQVLAGRRLKRAGESRHMALWQLESVE